MVTVTYKGKMTATVKEKLEYIDKISHETIRQVLKKTNLSLGVNKDG